MAGRSNVGKSSLINALVRQRLARTSAAPGKTRLANIYRVARGAGSPFYLVDLPGYGFARTPRQTPRGAAGGPSRSTAGGPGGFDRLVRAVTERHPGMLLLVDSRHPGLDNDRQAWNWLKGAVPSTAVVATKVDKLTRGERIRALSELESVFDDPVLPVSAVTGEGLDELWKLIERLANNSSPPRRSNSPKRRPRATAPPLQGK